MKEVEEVWDVGGDCYQLLEKNQSLQTRHQDISRIFRDWRKVKLSKGT